jgi:hypothetical protein
MNQAVIRSTIDHFEMKKTLIISDRLPSRKGAGAESLLTTILAVNDNSIIDLAVLNPIKQYSQEFLTNCSVAHPNLAQIHLLISNHSSHKSQPVFTELTKRLGVNESLQEYSTVFIFGDRNIVLFSHLRHPHKIAWPDDPVLLPSLSKSANHLLPVSTRIKCFYEFCRNLFFFLDLAAALRGYSLIIHHSRLHALQYSFFSFKRVLYAAPISTSQLNALDLKDRCPSSLVLQHHTYEFAHLGHLGGAASLASLAFLAQPSVQAKLTQYNLIIDFIGSVDIPYEITKKFESDIFRFHGFVEDVDQQIIASKCLVFPGSYRIGSRTRILHSLSLGVPVVAHRTVTSGIPELAECESLLLFNSVSSFVESLLYINSLDESSLLDLKNKSISFSNSLYDCHVKSWTFS